MTFSKRALLRRILTVIQILLLIPIGWFIWHVLMPRGFSSETAERIPLQLSSGSFEILYYAAKQPRGVLIVATGDGGWSNQWEEPVATHAADAGFAVAGWDCRRFADSRSFEPERQKLAHAWRSA